MLLWMALALGGPTDDLAERGWLQIEQGEAAAAHRAAMEALKTSQDPQAVVLYLESSTAMGLGARAVAETRDMPATLPWEEASEPLLEAVLAGDDARVAALVASLQSTYPEHPEALVALWNPRATKKTIRLREVVLRTDGTIDRAIAARLHRLRNLIQSQDATLSASVASRFDTHVAGPVSTDIQLHEIARAVAEKGKQISTLRLRAEELREVVERADRMLHASARAVDAAELWRALSATDPGAEARLAASLRLAGDLEGAAAALQRGWLAIGAPQPADVAVADLPRRTKWATELLAERSIATATSSPANAWADAVAATVLSGVVSGSTVGPAAAMTLGDTYKGTDKAAAALALAASSPDKGLHLEAAIAIVASSARSLPEAARGRDVYEQGFAEAWSRGAAVLAATEPNAALTYATLASLVGPTSADLSRLQAELHAQQQHADAAFQAAATARGLGADVDALITANYPGLGDAMSVATAIGGEPPPPQAEPSVRQRRATSAPSSPPKGARIGEMAPKWSITSEYGTISNASMKGRMVVLTFFTSDYAPCVEQLQSSGSLARRLRGEGLDVVHVAISRDANRGRFDDLYRVGQRWGELAWSPETATAFGVTREPTTWIIDRDGITRYYVDHRASGAELENVIRALVTE